MLNELRESLIIGIECILFSILLLVIFFLSGYAKDSLIQKTNQDIAITEISEYRNMFQFSQGKQIEKLDLEAIAGAAPYLGLSIDNAKNLGSILTGDDIVRFIGLYPKEYNVYIYNGRTSNLLELTNITDNDKWDINYVNAWLGADIVKDFYCVVVYDDLNYTYDSVIFTRVK